jgi:lysozyme
VTGSAYVQQQFLVTTANNTMTTPDANTANINTNPCMYDPTTKTFLPSSAWSLGANGTTLIQSAEGFAKVTSPDTATAYPDPATGGEPITIGYGSTAVAIDQPVTLGEMISRETAQSLLVYAVNKKFLPTLKATITVQLTQNMVDALLSLIYNIGPNNFTKSTLRKRINEQNWCAAGDAFLVWNKAGGKVLPGLTTRRTKERNLFLS